MNLNGLPAVLDDSLHGRLEMYGVLRECLGQAFCEQLGALTNAKMLATSLPIRAHSQKATTGLAVIEEKQSREVCRVHT
jgi:hypothetical protein